MLQWIVALLCYKIFEHFYGILDTYAAFDTNTEIFTLRTDYECYVLL